MALSFCYKRLLEKGYPFTGKDGKWLRHDLLTEFVRMGLSTEQVLPKLEHLTDFDAKKISKELEGINKKGMKSAGCSKKQSHFAEDMDLCGECPKIVFSEYRLGDGLTVRHSADGLSLVKIRVSEQGVSEKERRVVSGHIEIVERLDVDGDAYYRVFLEDEKLLSFKGLTKELRDSARVMEKRTLEDVLSATIDACPNFKSAHATFGVYYDVEGKLTICDTPMPVKEEQKKAWGMIADLIDRKVTPEEIQNYIDIIEFWHSYEVLPALGLGIASPFALALRTSGVLYPHAFNYAPEPDLGKSFVALLATEKMYGIEPTSGPGVNSPYRLASQLDSICLARTVDEAEKIKSDLWPTLKESAERRLADQRGTPDLGMRDYLSRLVMIFTGNSLPISTESLLKRFLVTRFDSSVKMERQSKANVVDRAYAALRPIGFQLLRWAVEKWPTWNALLADFLKWEEAIRKEYGTWVSPKRPQVWTCSYFGLKMLENSCKQTDVQWKAPSIEEFVSKVVRPVETQTWSFRRTQSEVFASWFALWRSEHEYVTTEKTYEGDERYSETKRITRIKGEGKIFRRDTLEVGDGEVSGFWVTTAILDKYNERKDGELRISSLVELARQSADVAGLPHSLVLASDGFARMKKMGGESARAAFIPDILRECVKPEKTYTATELASFDQKEKLKAAREVLERDLSNKEDQERELAERVGSDWPKWIKLLAKDGRIRQQNKDSPWRWDS